MGQKKSTFYFKTNAANVLRQLRTKQGLSMRQAGELVEKSDSYISHIENGRLKVPTGEPLAKLLELYKTSEGDFLKSIEQYQKKVAPRDQVIEILKKSTDQQAQVILKIAQALFA